MSLTGYAINIINLSKIQGKKNMADVFVKYCLSVFQMLKHKYICTNATRKICQALENKWKSSEMFTFINLLKNVEK